MFPTVLSAGAEKKAVIANSLRFRSSASAYLNRTPTSASNKKTWTFSAWIKRGSLGSVHALFCAGASDSISPYETKIQFNPSDQLAIIINGGGVSGGRATTSGVFLDTSSWYHIVCYVDMSASGQSNKARLYVNGVLQSVTYQNLATTDDSQINASVVHRIGANSYAASGYFDGYLADINFIDGQAIDASAFGEFDAITGVWKPKKYNGTYGTNGFHLDFKDGISTTTLGHDSSGNSNNWTTNNISLTPGPTFDWSTDHP